MQRLKKCWRWLRKNVLNKQMILYVLLAELIFWSPCIAVGLIAIFINSWYWTIFVAICTFWSAPFTPAIPLQLGLAVLIKKIVERKRNESRYEFKFKKPFKNNDDRV